MERSCIVQYKIYYCRRRKMGHNWLMSSFLSCGKGWGKFLPVVFKLLFCLYNTLTLHFCFSLYLNIFNDLVWIQSLWQGLGTWTTIRSREREWRRERDSEWERERENKLTQINLQSKLEADPILSLKSVSFYQISWSAFLIWRKLKLMRVCLI